MKKDCLVTSFWHKDQLFELMKKRQITDDSTKNNYYRNVYKYQPIITKLLPKEAKSDWIVLCDWDMNCSHQKVSVWESLA